MPGLSDRLFKIQQAFTQEALKPNIVEFADFVPDQPLLGSQGNTGALNVIPDENGYRPVLDYAAVSDAASSTMQGAAGVRDAEGNSYIYSGNSTTLYNTLTTLDDVSIAGGYNGVMDSNWEFAQFGNTVLATNYEDAIQSMVIGTTAFANALTSTLKPKARHIGVVKDFVVLGGTNDGTDGEQPGRVWWLAANSTVDADPDATTLCDFNDTAEGGWVQKVVSGEYGTIFQETQIQRMTFVGPPLIFQFDVVDRENGTPIPNSVVSIGRKMFYYADQGFMFFDGVQSTPIGNNRVDRWFNAQFNRSNISRLSSAIDPVKKLAIWAFPGTGATTTDPNRLLFYHWPTNKWGYAEIDLALIFQSLNLGYTLDGLDAIGTDIDDAALFPYSLDSRAYKGSGLAMGAFDQTHKYGTLSGSTLAAVIDTQESQPFGQQRSKVTETRPLVSNSAAAVTGTITGAIASRETTLAASTFGTAVNINANGAITDESTGRYHRFRTTIPAGADWDHAQGVAFMAAAAGNN